ncbi:hypothetical protein COV13_02495 [Candidatus Woesearchaeota archaeon CG10_big_fil_rev_8_21_14_0_10_32_9]|nr:MAG: hypothetical protein COV13_02495 [Candidatus Woesearchaeota archaeon CG10_big_fil_rev_8_21_14_0_10_32_9]
MSDKSFVLVSLKDNKSKNLTKVLSNDTCRKILDHLSKKDGATETEISKNLNLPLSTVHYNIQQLADSKLVSRDEYHYSEKGKEVIHYKLANKFIIISQEEDESVLDRLKSFLPVAIIFTAFSGLVAIYEYISRSFLSTSMNGAFDVITYEAKLTGPSAVAQTANAAPEIVTHQPYVALWIFLGGLLLLILLSAFDFAKSKKKPKK